MRVTGILPVTAVKTARPGQDGRGTHGQDARATLNAIALDSQCPGRCLPRNVRGSPGILITARPRNVGKPSRRQGRFRMHISRASAAGPDVTVGPRRLRPQRSGGIRFQGGHQAFGGQGGRDPYVDVIAPATQGMQFPSLMAAMLKNSSLDHAALPSIEPYGRVLHSGAGHALPRAAGGVVRHSGRRAMPIHRAARVPVEPCAVGRPRQQIRKPRAPGSALVS